MIRLVILCAFALTAPSLAGAATFRLASDAAETVACSRLPATAPSGERALYKLLSKRLGQDIQDCPTAGFKAAADALLANQVDMALLDPAAYDATAGKVRAILTLRPKGGLDRTQVVVAVLASSPLRKLGDIKGTGLVFVGSAPYDHELPRQALSDQGAGPDYFSTEVVAVSAEAALKHLRNRGAAVIAMNADAWQRSCRGVKSQDQPCGDLRIIWKGRPRATKALVVRTDMPAQLRYRIIGIYTAMHLEAPDAFDFASSFAAGGENFNAAEAAALSPSKGIR